MSRCLDRRGCWIGVCVFCVIRENNLYPCCSLVPLFKCLHCILLRADHHRQHAARNSQVIPRHRPARNAHGARRLPRLSPVTDAALRETRTTRPVAPTAVTAPRTTTRTTAGPTTTPTTTARRTTSRPRNRRLPRCTPLLLRSEPTMMRRGMDPQALSNVGV